MLSISIILCVCFVHCAVDGFAVKRLINPDQNELFELSIAHINDFHARFVQTSFTSSSCHLGKENECIGGLARIVTATRRLLRDRNNTIFLNAGDNYQGTIWYNVFKWNATAYFMNMLPHDAMTIGNHDFDDGVAGLVPFLRRFRAPALAANIDCSEEPTMQGLYEGSTIIVRGNHTIGVIGVIIKTTNSLARTGKLKFLDEVETVNAEAERLQAIGVKIIIVLSHVGLNLDKVIAASCPAVDVIVGGHSNSFLYTGTPPFTSEKPVDTYPMVVKQNSTGRTVLIVQTASFSKYLGNLTVWFDHHGEVVNWEGNPIFLGTSIEEDPETLSELKPWAEEIAVLEKKVVGETRSFLNGKCKTGECNLANLVTDAMVHAFKNQSEHWTSVAISCINAGGIRTSIPIGKITYGDLNTVLPFENVLSVVELKGEDLLLALEECVTRSREKDYFYFNGLLHWSGIRVVYNMSMPAWSRVTELSVRCQACKEPTFEPLDRDKSYRVIVTDFILRGGDGLTTIMNKHRVLEIGPVDIDVFVKYVEAISPVTYEIDHRMQLLGKWTE